MIPFSDPPDGIPLRAEAAPVMYPAAVHQLALVYVEAKEKPIKPGEVSHYNGLAAVRDAVIAELAAGKSTP